MLYHIACQQIPLIVHICPGILTLSVGPLMVLQRGISVYLLWTIGQVIQMPVQRPADIDRCARLTEIFIKFEHSVQ
ncbi:hypothetical protein BDW75DRAFT_213401 [Aspergillus navahoensis]